MRLDTSKILQDMELFLRGQRLVPTIDVQNQQTGLEVRSFGKPLMNEEGIQCVLMQLSQTVNSHGVQGNWSKDLYEQFIAEADFNFSKDLWVNLRKWAVDIENYNVISNAIMNLLQQFASRIIENKERESYGMSMKTSESVVQTPNRASSLFGG